MNLHKLTAVMFAILFGLGIAGCEREQPADQGAGGPEQAAPTTPGDTTTPQSPPAGGEQPGGGMGGGAGQP